MGELRPRKNKKILGKKERESIIKFLKNYETYNSIEGLVEVAKEFFENNDNVSLEQLNEELYDNHRHYIILEIAEDETNTQDFKIESCPTCNKCETGKILWRKYKGTNFYVCNECNNLQLDFNSTQDIENIVEYYRRDDYIDKVKHKLIEVLKYIQNKRYKNIVELQNVITDLMCKVNLLQDIKITLTEKNEDEIDLKDLDYIITGSIKDEGMTDFETILDFDIYYAKTRSGEILITEYSL